MRQFNAEVAALPTWAEQAEANAAPATPTSCRWSFLAVRFVVLGHTWFQLPTLIQSSVLRLGWPVLYVVTIAQTIVMISKLFRRQRGYRV